MSELHGILNDPNRPGESTLSILLNSGDAAYTFQRKIFKYLNIEDATHLRMANKRLNKIIGGEARDILNFVAPGIATVSVENSTLRLLGGRCYGRRFFPAPARNCRVGPQVYVRIASCTGLPPPLNPNGVQPCRGDVCRRCVGSAIVHYMTDEQNRLAKSRGVSLCRKCQMHEARRHPEGFSSCICRATMSSGYKCDACRYSTIRQLIHRDDEATDILLRTHKDLQGNMFMSNRIRRREYLGCPGCGRDVQDHDGERAAVIYCMACKGIEVKATTGAYFQASRPVPIAPTRRSARIRDINVAKPALTFTPPPASP